MEHVTLPGLGVFNVSVFKSSLGNLVFKVGTVLVQQTNAETDLGVFQNTPLFFFFFRAHIKDLI